MINLKIVAIGDRIYSPNPGVAPEKDRYDLNNAKIMPPNHEVWYITFL